MRRGVLIAAALVALAACSPQAPSSSGGASIEARRLSALEDERAIRAAADGLDLAVDRKDWAAARGFFADAVEADFSSLGGTPGAVSADALIEGWRRNLHRNKPSFHLRGGEAITLEGDRASMISNGYAWNALPQRTSNQIWEGWGRYEHSFTRTPDGWRVSGLKFFLSYERGDAGVRTETAPAE